MKNHFHLFHELAIVVSGQIHWTLMSDQNAPAPVAPDCMLKAREAIFVRPRQWHYERVEEPGVVEWTGFSAPPEALEGLPMETPIPLGSWSSEIFNVTRQIHFETLHRPADHQERIALLLGDLLLLFRRICRSVPAPRRDLSREDHLEAARLYLEQNTGRETVIGHVARYHGYSRSHFETLFAGRYGLTPKRYLQRARLRAVLESICGGVRSPKELAERHGFSDSAYFCRWFRRQTGMTPARYQPGQTSPEGSG